jgi:hypothetical protein
LFLFSTSKQTKEEMEEREHFHSRRRPRHDEHLLYCFEMSNAEIKIHPIDLTPFSFSMHARNGGGRFCGFAPSFTCPVVSACGVRKESLTSLMKKTVEKRRWQS